MGFCLAAESRLLFIDCLVFVLLKVCFDKKKFMFGVDVMLRRMILFGMCFCLEIVDWCFEFNMALIHQGKKKRVFPLSLSLFGRV